MTQFAAKPLSGHFLGWWGSWGALMVTGERNMWDHVTALAVSTFLVYVKVDELELQSLFS